MNKFNVKNGYLSGLTLEHLKEFDWHLRISNISFNYFIILHSHAYSSFLLFSPFPLNLRLIHGIGKPDEVLECVSRGVDLFEGFFPYQVTEQGKALSFNFKYKVDPEAEGIS